MQAMDSSLVDLLFSIKAENFRILWESGWMYAFEIVPMLSVTVQNRYEKKYCSSFDVHNWKRSRLLSMSLINWEIYKKDKKTSLHFLFMILKSPLQLFLTHFKWLKFDDSVQPEDSNLSFDGIVYSIFCAFIETQKSKCSHAHMQAQTNIRMF